MKGMNLNKLGSVRTELPNQLPNKKFGIRYVLSLIGEYRIPSFATE